MSGGHLQLVANNNLDNLYLTGDPQITNFKIVYRRHTNFTMYPKNIFFSSNPTFGSLGRCRIRKHADLVTKLFLVITLPTVLLEYPILTKKEMSDILKSHGIIWNFSGIGSEPVTLLEYNIEIIPLIDNQINVLQAEYDEINVKEGLVNGVFNNPVYSSVDGRTFANLVFTDFITHDENSLELLYRYIVAFRNDIASTPKALVNFSDVKSLFYNELLTELIVTTITQVYMIPNIIFYHIVDFGNYVFNQALTNYNLKFIFDKGLDFGYTQGEIDTALDGYIVYNKYFESLPISRQLIASQNDINVTRQELLDDIEWNFRKNISELISINSILSENRYDSGLQFRIGYFKKFKFISTNVFNGNEPFNILVNTTKPKLNDHFSNSLTLVPDINEPASVNHFYGDFVNATIQQFNGSSRALFRDELFSDYFSDYKVWYRLLLSTYLGSGPGQYGDFDNLYVMNLIPLFNIYDIPLMVNYWLTNSQYAIYAPAFDLVGSTFQTTLYNNIIDSYNKYDLSFPDPHEFLDIKSYLEALKDTYRDGSDNLLIGMFKPDIIQDIDTSVYSPDVVDPNETYTQLIPIEYVIISYVLEYTQLIFDFTTDPVLYANLVNFIVNNVVNLFRKTDLPTYATYTKNNYTLFNYSLSNIVNTNSNAEPPFLDAASSIWYSISRSLIPQFNNVFISGILSPSYFTTDLGESMNELLDLYKTTLTNNNIPFDSNFTNVNFYKVRYDIDPITDVSYYLDGYNTAFSNYTRDNNLLKIENAALNRSRNYYKGAMENITIFYDEIINNPDIYYPVGYGTPTYTGPIVPDLLDSVVDNIYIEFTPGPNILLFGARDIVSSTRFDLEFNAIVNAPINNNPYTTGSYLFDWFDTYHTVITPTLLDQYYVVNAIWQRDVPSNESDLSPIYKDPNVQLIYDKLQSQDNVLNYMADTIVNDAGYKKFVDKIVNDSRTTTYNNFIDVLSEQRLIVVIQLDSIAVEDAPGHWSFFGSEFAQMLDTRLDRRTPPFAWAKEIGHRLCETLSVEIGGGIIETHTYNTLHVQHQLNIDENKEKTYNIMIGNIPALYTYDRTIKQQTVLYIPLQFWFCKHTAEALPLSAMKYTNIDIILKIPTLDKVAVWDENAMFIKKPVLDCKILANYIYVEKEERYRIATSRLEYLFEVQQNNGIITFGKHSLINNTIMTQLFFNNSSKMLVWELKFKRPDQDKFEKLDWTNNQVVVDGKVVNPVSLIKIRFNGQMREMNKESGFYQYCQPYMRGSGSLNDNTFIYTFALDPNILQPSGTANMNRLNDVNIVITLTDTIVSEMQNNNMTIEWETVSYSYNWLRVMSGMAAPMYI